MTRANPSVRLQSTTPVFLVGDIASTMTWYRDELGFETDPFPDRPPYAFCILRRDDVEIFLQQLDGYQKPHDFDKRDGGVWNTYVRTKGVLELFSALSSQANVEIVEPLCRQPYGQTEFWIKDPNGYVLVFAEAL